MWECELRLCKQLVTHRIAMSLAAGPCALTCSECELGEPEALPLRHRDLLVPPGPLRCQEPAGAQPPKCRLHPSPGWECQTRGALAGWVSPK